MRKKLQGLSLILFGILLCICSVAMETVLPGDYNILACVLGIIFGIVGLVFAFMKTEK